MNKIKRRHKVMLSLLISSMLIGTSYADTTTPSVNVLSGQKSVGALTTFNQLSSDDQDRIATQWKVTTKEYKHYLSLMKSTPEGKWYKNSDPAEVLAMSTGDQEKVMHYAKEEARLDHVKVSRELLLNTDYGIAYKTLYPNEKPIQMPGTQPSGQLISSIKSGDHVWLFTQLNDPIGAQVAKHLVSVIQQHPGTYLDVYFVGKASNAAISSWAKSEAIPVALVNQAKVITLQQDHGRYRKLAKGNESLPWAMLVHSGKNVTMNMSSLW